MQWIAYNWIDLIQTAGVVLGLLATAHSIREETKSRKVTNALALTHNHKELWSLLIQNPALKRVLDKNAKLKRKPPTLDEELFAQMLILHIRTALKARGTALEFADEDLATDVQRLFELPLLKAIWKRTKPLQGPDLADLVEGKKQTKGQERTLVSHS